jgi:hypothetical protein
MTDGVFSYSRPTCNYVTAVCFCELSNQLYSSTESFDMQSQLLIAALSNNRNADQRVDNPKPPKMTFRSLVFSIVGILALQMCVV